MKKLSTEERQQKLNQWAQARAEALREEHAGGIRSELEGGVPCSSPELVALFIFPFFGVPLFSSNQANRKNAGS